MVSEGAAIQCSWDGPLRLDDLGVCGGFCFVGVTRICVLCFFVFSGCVFYLHLLSGFEFL